MARIAVAGFIHETNTFAPGSTALADFGERSIMGKLYRGSEILGLSGQGSPVGGFLAAAAGHDLVPVAYALAEPSATIEASAFNAIADEIAAGVGASDCDAVFLDLHGALVAQDFPDGEAELLRRVRAAVGPYVPIGVALDLHGNVGPATLADADVTVAYRTYPHVDMAETGARVATLILEKLAGGARWRFAHRQLPFLIPLDAQSTLTEPASGLYKLLPLIEARDKDVVALSLMMGFILADVPFAGPSVFAYGRTQVAAERAVDEVLAAALASEPGFVSSAVPVAVAAERAARWSGPGALLLADIQDNAGGGATSDTTDLARALLAAGVADALLGVIHDPETARLAHAAGVGAVLDLAVGGKRMTGQTPLNARYQVEATADGPVTLTGPVSPGFSVELGPTAALRTAGLLLVVSSQRTQCYDQALFRHVGIEPATHRVIAVKSTNHYRADFGPLAGEIVPVAAPGVCRVNPIDIPYRQLRRDVRLYGGGPTLAEYAM